MLPGVKPRLSAQKVHKRCDLKHTETKDVQYRHYSIQTIKERGINSIERKGLCAEQGC